MEAVAAPRGAYKITFNGKNITADLAPFLEEVTYTDRIDGQADELDILLSDRDGRWLRSWYPEKGATIAYEYGYAGQPLVKAGSFALDEIEIDGPPNTIRLRALAAGLNRQAKTRIGKAYENTTLKEIVAKVAKRLKATVYGTIADIKIVKATQYGEADWAFLVRLCREYGYEVKLTDSNQKLVVTKLKDLAKSGPVRTLRPRDMSSWKYRDKITEVPAKTDVKHHDPDKKRTVTGSADASHKDTSADHRKRVTPAKTPAQAKAIAQAEQERHEQDKTSFEISLPGDPKLVAGALVEVIELGMIDGDYLIIEAKHSINKSASYGTTIQNKKMQDKA